MIGGVTQLVIGIEDQDRAKRSGPRRWGSSSRRTHAPGKTVAGGAYAGQGRSHSARPSQGAPPTAPDRSLPTSNVSFHAKDLQQTYWELTARGVKFPLPPTEQSFGWWSLFEDPDNNRFALAPPPRLVALRLVCGGLGASGS